MCSGEYLFECEPAASCSLTFAPLHSSCWAICTWHARAAHMSGCQPEAPSSFLPPPPRRLSWIVPLVALPPMPAVTDSE